jgi:hypothetical protein
MPFNTFANTDTFGVYLQDNKTPSGTQRNSNTVIQNNIIYGYNADYVFFTQLTGAQGGINLNFNNYFSATAKPFGSGDSTVASYTFAQWKAAITGSDVNSKFQDPLLLDLTAFRATGVVPYDFTKANLGPGSPALNAGTPQTFPPVNYTGAARATWNIGAF